VSPTIIQMRLYRFRPKTLSNPRDNPGVNWPIWTRTSFTFEVAMSNATFRRR
jgi:hypothetical protein